TSPHHLGATMVTGRTHRMTELFARLAPGADLEAARTELRTVHSAILKEYPEAYPVRSDFRIDAKLLRDQIVSPARTVLLVLLAAAGLIFVIACSNVANLILARSVAREGERSIRAALGASAVALRRTLLAESLLLCGSGAILGVIVAQWMVPILGRYASRFSVRALDVTVDSSVLWVGVGLAMFAAVLLGLGARARRDRRLERAVGRCGPGHVGGGAAGLRAAPTVSRRGWRPGTLERKRSHHVGHEASPPAVCRYADRRVVRAAGGRRGAGCHPSP